MKDADNIELKLSVPDEDRRSTVMALGMDALEALIRQVYFFDTPDLDLDRAGVVVRARRTQGKPDDSVVKLRPVVPADLSPELRGLDEFGVEVDALPGGYVCSASFKHKHDSGDVVKPAVAGGKRLSKLFSKQQRAFFAEHAPDGIDLDELSVLGPVHVLKLKFSPDGYDRKLVTELWFYPDASRILDCPPSAPRPRAFRSPPRLVPFSPATA